MRQSRLKVPSTEAVAFYHCLSRVVDRRFVFGPREKERFTALMREYEVFCGVRVLTHCVMANHFHILVEVPQPPSTPLTDEELLTRIEGLTGLAGDGTARQILLHLRAEGAHEAAESFRQKYLARMWDISAFMKLLKQRFTQWFNLTHGRKGTLWEERFKSVLVDGAGQILATMAAYIDLNPTRAEITPDPKDYRWCGYGEAMAGRKRARDGIKRIASALLQVDMDQLSWRQSIETYRMWLYGHSTEKGLQTDGTAVHPGLTQHAVRQKIEERGRVPLSEYLRLRVRYFADGAVLGSRLFVDETFQRFRRRFGARRKTGARRMRGVDSQNLFALRDLQVRILGPDPSS